jgi:hypothetical protein
MKKYYIGIGILFALLFSACKKDEKSLMAPPWVAESFFNYNKSDVFIYKGDSIIYNDFDNSVDTIHFFYKDSVQSIDTVQTQLVYQFERMISYDGISYQYLNNYSINRSIQGVLRYGNLSNRYILPPKFYLNSTWDGNQFQSTVEQMFLIDSIATIDYSGGLRDMVNVLQVEEQNLIDEVKETEQYVEDFGMTYQYRKRLRKDINTGQIKSGSIVILALKP